jgi:cysteine desulfuration protein SufE
MSLAEKQQQLAAQLSALKNGQDRLALLVAQAKERPSQAYEFRTKENLIPGCLAKLWLTTEFRDRKCFFACDSDSLIVKAIAGMLCDLYSGQTPAEILAHNPDFLVPLGITQHLTPNRRNALSRVWERIKHFAEASSTQPANSASPR